MADDTENNDTAQPFAFSPQMQSYADAIKAIESSGGDYGVLGPKTKSGDRAHGAYQVMGANIPQWTQEALGASMDPKEFLADASAQDKVFNYKFGQYLQKYGNPQDAASAWFTGRPLSQGAGSSDVLGTTGQDYVNKFNNLLSGTPTAPPQHFQAMAPGALSASSLTGNDGALWNIVNQQQQQPTWGDNLIKLGSLVAGINSPSQAQTIAGLASKPSTSQADKLVKFLQLKSALQKVNNASNVTFQATLADGTPYYTNQQGAVSDAQGNALPNDFMTQHNVKDTGDKPPPRGIAQLYGDSQNRAFQAANIADKAQAIRQQLRDHPELADQFNALAGAKSWVNNAIGASDDMSQLQKDMAAVINQHMLSVGQSVKGAQTGKVLDTERNSISPQQALSDAVTADQALKRVYDRQMEIYGANANTISSLGTEYPKAFKFNDPKTGKETTWDDYSKSRYDAWGEGDKKIDAGTAAFIGRHDIKTGKKKDTGFLGFFGQGN